MTGKTDFNKSELYTLSIRLATDGFSFSVFDPTSAESPATMCETRRWDDTLPLTANLKNILQDTGWTEQTFRRINILVCGKRYTLVPQEFFMPEMAESIFYQNHPKQDNETILYDTRQQHGTVLLFGIDRHAHSFLKERFPNAHFYHQACPLLECFSTQSRLGNRAKMYAHLRKDAADAFAFSQGRLLVANSYTCHEMIDRLYYLLYLWKSLGFDQQSDELHLCGLLDAKEQLVTELRKFIRNVYIMNPVENIDLQYITTCE